MEQFLVLICCLLHVSKDLGPTSPEPATRLSEHLPGRHRGFLIVVDLDIASGTFYKTHILKMKKWLKIGDFIWFNQLLFMQQIVCIKLNKNDRHALTFP